MYPLSATLDAFARSVPPALATPDALARVRAVADGLPAALSHRLCLECRLAEGEEEVDLIVGVEERGREILARRDLPAEGAWGRVRALCAAWGAAGSPLAETVERLWLEFDVRGPTAAAPAPGVFLDLTERASSAGAPRERASRVAEALRALLGAEPDARVADGVLSCHQALPPGARIPYAGVLIPRGTGRVRLCVAGLGADRLPAYLAAVGWPEPPGLRGLLSPLAQGPEGPRPSLLHLDVGDGPTPAIGVELAFARRPQVRGRLPGGRFLDLLVERGWCSPAKRDALRAWPGCSAERLPHELWPGVALRHLAHVKLTAGPGGVSAAKAYLSLLHLPRPRRPAVEPGLYAVEPSRRAEPPRPAAIRA